MDQSNMPEGWKLTKLGEIGEISGGGTPSTKLPEYWGGEIRWLVPSEVTRCNGLFISDTERKITEAGLASCVARLLPVGTVLMTSRATIGEVVINTVPMATNQGFINVKCDGTEVFNEYLAFWIKQHKQIFEDRANGVTFKEITKSNFKTIPIHLPPLTEQRAIARALRAVQEAREARRKELQLERERKAALMQHLFTHGTRGEARKQTEIGEMPESWKIIKLGEVIQAKNGINFSANQKGTGVLTVDVLNMYSESIYLQTDRLYRVNIALKKEYLLQPNDVLFVRSSLKQEGVGWAALFPSHFEPVTFCGFLIRARLTSKEISPKFLINYLRLPFVRSLLVSQSGKVAITNINQASIQRISMPLPSLAEQVEIADTIQACDTKISTLVKEATLLDELFRAMLEELMTGRLLTLPLIED